MRFWFSGLFSALLLIGLTQASAQAGVIFDNTTTFQNAITFDVAQYGNEVLVSQPARVSDLEIGVNQQGAAGTTDLQAFLYANDGTGGAPGTLLWKSTIMTNVVLTPGNDLIAFAVPNVDVPTIFTWAIQISNSQPIAVGLPSFDPPTVGAVLAEWFAGPSDWSRGSGPANFDYMARITAVPEPSTILNGSLALVIALGWTLNRRRRKPVTTP